VKQFPLSSNQHHPFAPSAKQGTHAPYIVISFAICAATKLETANVRQMIMVACLNAILNKFLNYKTIKCQLSKQQVALTTLAQLPCAECRKLLRPFTIQLLGSKVVSPPKTSLTKHIRISEMPVHQSKIL
jgi:hypothetical protein